MSQDNVDPRTCATCAHIKDCQTVSTQKIDSGYSCSRWESPSATDLEARMAIIRDFGPWALRYDVPGLQPSARLKRRRRKHG